MIDSKARAGSETKLLCRAVVEASVLFVAIVISAVVYLKGALD